MTTQNRIYFTNADGISSEVTNEKYAKADEKELPLSACHDAIFKRVAKGAAQAEKNVKKRNQIEQSFYTLMSSGYGVGGGRIMSNCGTNVGGTMINCFVQGVGDSITECEDETAPGIYVALAKAAESMRRGGGVGYNFSKIRPKGAYVNGTDSEASGPCSYINVFDTSCETVESAGKRRGAQLGALYIYHPDIEEFIYAKREEGRWENFNVSVAVTDKFMEAVRDDTDWELYHVAEPCARLKKERGNKCYYKPEENVWVYDVVRARDLWEKIMKSTYDYAEPGILYIDVINRLNNLNYCEVIEATNPCGEQPLQSDGCCDLGPLFLHKFVVNPFTPEAYFNKSEFEKAVRVQVRFLDNILDVTLWPHESQKDQARLKRRIGLGFSGLGTALIMLGIRYNSHEGRDVAEMIAKTMAEAAYNASIDLAKEKGAFPAFDADKYLAKGTFASTLPLEIQSRIREYGIRNSHLISIAPTGTVSLAFGDNCTGGLEPMFMVAYKRSKRMADGSRKEFTVVEHALNVWLNKQENNHYALTIFDALVNGETAVTWYETTVPIKTILPSSFVSALEISVDDHMAMVAVIQKYCDSACSKTVNVPENYDYDDFKGLYFRAWEAGLKGLSTYRPNPTRQGILNAITPETPEATEAPKVEEVIAEKMDKIEAQFKSPVLNMERLRDIAKDLASRYGALYENYMHNRIDDCPHGSGSAIRFYQKVHTHEDHISVLGHVAYQKVEIFDWQTGFQFTFRRPYEVAITSSGSTSDWCNFAGRNWSMLARSDVKDLIKALHSTKNVRNDNGSIRFGTQDSGKPRFHRSEAAVFAYIVNRSLVDKGIFSKDYTLATAEEVIYAEILEYERRRVTGYEAFKAKIAIDSIHAALCNEHVDWSKPVHLAKEHDAETPSNQESATMALMGEAFHQLGNMMSESAMVQEQTQSKLKRNDITTGDKDIIRPELVTVPNIAALSIMRPDKDIRAFAIDASDDPTVAIGGALYRYVHASGKWFKDVPETNAQAKTTDHRQVASGTGLKCPECHTNNLVKRDGCKVCTSCGYEGSCG